MSIKRDAVAKCAGPQKIHRSTVEVELVSEESNVLFFSYNFSENKLHKFNTSISNNYN